MKITRLIIGIFFFMAFNGCQEGTDQLEVSETSNIQIPVEDEEQLINLDITEEDDQEVPSSSCNKSENLSNITKPTGVFTSLLTEKSVLNKTINGSLIRVTWAELEPSPGVFNFGKIEEKLALLPAGKKWSLGIHGGYSSVDLTDPDLYPSGSSRAAVSLQMSPSWLESDFGVTSFEMAFRAVTVYMPKYWDSNLQSRLAMMLNKVADKYAADPNLQLVYVPQMTSNGIEGHFNGVNSSTLKTAANVSTDEEFEDIWVNAAIQASKATASAFPTKAIAFEVHEVVGRVNSADRIINTFLSDLDFENRAGAAMWWISGGTDYQPELVELLKNYEGDLYGQVIGNSSQAYRFPDDDYTNVFKQAKELCMRYIEPWNYEFDNNTHDQEMDEFNRFSTEFFN